MAFEKIENADLSGKMISELSDVPELTADELKKRFDAASKDVIIPKFNKLIDALAALSAASNIGMNPPEGITAEQNIAAVITALAVSVKSNSDLSHSHSNKAVIDAITADAKKKYDDLVSLFSAIKTVSNVVKDDSTLLPTGKAIVDYVKELGGGDMLKATYDSDDDGVVDDASKLGGQAPAYYQKSTDNTLQTDNKTVTGAINEVYGMAQNGGKNLIGEDFSSEKSYTVGKHVINGNSRYRFIVDHPAGPWDASHVEEIPVDKEMEDLNEKMQCGTFDFTISQQEAGYFVQFPKEFKKIPVVTFSIERVGFTDTTHYHIQGGYTTTKQFAFLAVCTDQGTLHPSCKAHWIAMEP